MRTGTDGKPRSASTPAGGVAEDPKHAWRSDNIGRLLLMVFSGFEARVFDELQRQGNAGVRQVHFNVLRHVDYETGTRLVDLARRAGVTKGAMGQLAAECERRGFVAIRPDATDRRAKSVTFTARGRALMDRLHAILRKTEREIADIVGERRFGELRASLAELRDALARDGARPRRGRMR